MITTFLLALFASICGVKEAFIDWELFVLCLINDAVWLNAITK